MLSKTGLPVTFLHACRVTSSYVRFPKGDMNIGGRLMAKKENVKSRLKFNILLDTLKPIFMKEEPLLKNLP